MENVEGGREETGRDDAHHDPPVSMKIAISKYHKQLLEGCGRACCENENCASSGKFPKLTSNEAAARAIACLVDGKARLCDPLPASEEAISEPLELLETLCTERVKALLTECRESGFWAPMRQYLDRTLGSKEVLLRSFVSPSFADKVLKVCDHCSPELSSKYPFGNHPPGAPRKKRPRESDGSERLKKMLSGSQIRSPDREEVAVVAGEGERAAGGSSMAAGDTVQHSASVRSGEALDTASASHPRHSATLSRSASDLGGIRGRGEHCSDCGWRNVAVEDKDAQTESMDVSRGMASRRLSKQSEQCRENALSLAELRSGKSPTNHAAARECFALLFANSSDHEHYLQPAMGAVAQLCSDIDFQLQYECAWESTPSGVIHIINLLFELPFVQWFEFIDVGFTPLCKMCTNLGADGQMILASVWAEQSNEWIQDRISLVQQAMTLRVLTVIDAVGSLPRFTDRIEPLPTTVQTLSILYKTILMKSKRTMEGAHFLDASESLGAMKESSEETMDTSENTPTAEGTQQEAGAAGDTRYASFLDAFKDHELDEEEAEEERLANGVAIDAWTIARAPIPLNEFVNGTLSENFSVEDDFVAYKSFQNGHAFSVMPEYSFVLNTEVKQRFLMLCNRIRQRTERRHALADSIAYGLLLEPYLRLTVRRDHVVHDALDALHAIALDNVASFKKQLRVYFDGEHAVDEGGVSKEFYQLITQQLFCPDYGMFVANSRTGLFWFNSQCTFCDDEYSLIGLLFGLAIYNNILIDVRFPMALYTKLLARPAVFEELEQLDPDLYKGLKELLECDGDVESIYCFTFQVSYKDAYGNTHNVSLIKDGDKVPVTNENKKRFVWLYADLLLNKLVERQFEAFSAGFSKVANRGLLRRLCLPHEVEELVCGVLDLNFDLLAQSTRYQNGFTESSQTIKDFWTVAKSMSVEEKKMLLQFITGSDRAPVGGLAKLEMVIARNGDDKRRLPTAHTCYNVMLLPDYSDLEVTRERVAKAISYSRGFGLQ